jgi:putative hydrolase of the HAD superfamily
MWLQFIADSLQFAVHMRTETVFLDAGGVLVWPNWTRVADALRRHGVNVDPRLLADADAPARFSLDQAHVVGSTTDQRRSSSFFELVLMEAGLALSEQTAAALTEIEDYHRDHNLWEIVPSFVRPTLEQLREAGYTLVVVSNANGTVHKKFDRLGLSPLFDVILDSAVEGVEKPDPRFFQLALDRANGRRETTVHVGDFYNIDVVGARNAGLRAVLVDERDLHGDADCPRIRSIAELPALLASE